jgi:undecaprenyl-diphosphatase
MGIMVSNLEALLLGTVQGISEFLPISSSGHLVLVRYHLNWGDSLPLYVGIATNTGTLFAVLVALRQVVWDTLLGVLASLRFLWQQQVRPRLAPERVAVAYVDAEARNLTGDADLADEREQRRLQAFRLALLVIVGSLPTAVIGLTLEPFFERLGTPVPTAVALVVTGLVLWFVPNTGHKTDPRAITWRDALLVGAVQGLAVMPGISRAGATIGFLLWRGVSSDLAARFSFLLYLVVSFGVGLLGIGELAEANIALLPLAIMTITSFAAGYFALIGLLRILQRGQLHRFAPYVWTVALLTLLRVALT